VSPSEGASIVPDQRLIRCSERAARSSPEPRVERNGNGLVHILRVGRRAAVADDLGVGLVALDVRALECVTARNSQDLWIGVSRDLLITS
jgi:hypothetical protein